MCGIVGAIAQRNIVPIIVEGLKRLEYRGYDSAGAAVLHDGRLERVRRVGRVAEMENQVASQGLQGNLGIGHTRWATHGGVTEGNAHPLISRNRVAVVHNGIIENHEAQRARLTSLGYVFESQTDTEVIAHLIDYHLTQSGDLFEATRHAVAELQGAYAIGVVAVDSPDYICCARMGCPLLIGLGEGENYFASDVSALLSQTRRVIYLDDGDVAAVSRNGVHIVDRNGSAVERPERLSAVSADAIELGPYDHYMQKEIHEQPRALANTLEGVVDGGINARLFGAEAEAVFQGIDSILILAAGTSYYASLVGKQWLEAIARIPCNVELGHEYRYRDSIPNPRQLVVTVSQSGETLDTMEALKRAQALGHEQTLSICNVQESALPRASKLVFYTRAGTEIGVASTKAFTAQLTVLLLLALKAARQRGHLDADRLADLLSSLRALPSALNNALEANAEIRIVARLLSTSDNALFLGRGLMYPLALEGALKLKEISYIHAEAYASGELKHGPIALVDETMPVIVMAPCDALFDKTVSNMQEVMARGGRILLVSDARGIAKAGGGVWQAVKMPEIDPILSPILYALPAQLLAYHTAVAKGTDVDQPRNLAKSVTVE